MPSTTRTFIQPSFAKGELAPALHGRVDTAAYQVGLKTARNVLIRSSGGVMNRPGLLFVGPAKDHTYAPRLIPFQFKTSDKYMLEFGNLYMRVIRSGAQVTEADRTITGATAANPVVLTTSGAHGFSNNDQVYVAGVVGMTQLNGRWFIAANVAATTLELQDQLSGTNLNGTAFTAYTSGGTVARIFTLTTPYVTADLTELKYVQSADVMTLVHKSYGIRELSRTGHTSWTLTEPTFAPTQGFPTGQTITVNSAGGVTDRYQVTAIADETFEESLPALNNTTRTITGITQANPAVVTSAAHGFTNGDEVHIAAVVGMVELNGRRFKVANQAANTFELQSENSTAYVAYSSAGTANQTFVRVTNSIATRDNTIAWTAVTGAQKYSVYYEKNGIFGFIGETEKVTFNDANIAPDLGETPPKPRNPFRGTGNYPGAVSYYEQRRVFGGSTNKPDTEWFSQVGNQSNFSVSSPTQQDDAITATLNALEVNEIRHFVPGRDLIVFTSGSEWLVNSGPEAAFAADTLKQKPQSFWGCSHLRPIVSGTTILFVQENKAIIRSLGYSLQIDGYTGTNLNILASHIFETYTLSEWSYAHSPEPIIHGVRSDGEATHMTFNQEQEVIAWTHSDTLGKFERVAVLKSGPEATEDDIFFVVKRTIGSSTARYIERLHSRKFTDVRDCFFVDCGLSLDAPVAVTGTTAANPVVVTAAGHGFANGDEVDLSDIEWVSSFDAVDNEVQPDQLNGRRYKVANQTASTFELTKVEDGSNIDGSAFNAYAEGGKARKAVLTVTGLWHIEGKAAAILADGNVVSGKTVANGSITLPRKASRVHVGLKYISDIETLNIEESPRTIQGKIKKIPSVVVRFEKSRGMFIGPTSDNMIEMKQRQFEKMSDPTALLTGDKEISLLPLANANGRIFIRQRYPLPITVLAVIPDVSIGS